MSSLFSKPSIPTPQAPEPVPTIDQAAAANDYADRLRMRRGAASTILVPNSPFGSLGAAGSAAAPQPMSAKAILG
jgi:hypothetical protein